MQSILKSFTEFAAIITVLSVSCSKEHDIPIIKLSSLNDTTFIPVNKLLVYGPYKTDLDSLLVNQTNSASDSSFFLTELSNDSSFGNSGKLVESEIECIDFSKLINEKTDDAFFYSKVIIKSRKPMQIVIMNGNRLGMEIWLNESKIAGTLGKRVYNGYNQYLTYTKAKLIKGKNYLTIKHYCSAKEADWTSICHISSYEYAREYYYRKSNYDLIESGIVPIGGKLVLSSKFAFTGDNEFIEVTDKNGKTVISGEYDLAEDNIIQLPVLSEGLYYCYAKFPDFVTEQPFYYGELESLKQGFISNIEELREKAPEEAIHLDALQKRMMHLMRFRSFSGQVISNFSLEISEDNNHWDQVFEGSSDVIHCDSSFIPVNASIRYLKFVGHMNSSNSYNNLSEIEAVSHEGMEIKPMEITASGYYGKQVPENIADKDYSTFWEQEGDGKWLKIDYGQSINISEIRLAFLKNILEKELEVRLWERKVVILADELWKLKSRSLLTPDLYKNLSGRHLRGYISEIDHDTLNYMVQVPKAAEDGRKLPLVVFIPINMGTRTPFLTSMLAADILKDDKINIEIERHNMMAAIVSCNNYESELMPNFYTELNNIMNDIKSDFNVDTSRIYLFGICASGAKSFQYAANFPHKVAAISNVSAEINMDNLLRISNFSNIPMLFLHSKGDTHMPIRSVLYFLDLAKKTNITPGLYLFKNASHYFYANSFLNLPFEFFEGKSIDYSPEHINFTTNELKYGQAYWLRIDGLDYHGTPRIEANVIRNKLNIATEDISAFTLKLDSIPYDHSKELTVEVNSILKFKGIPQGDSLYFKLEQPEGQSGNLKKNSSIEGPINHFFANSFLVVQGTKGDDDSKTVSKALTEEFKAMWKEYYYSDCRSKLDVEITLEDIDEANLVLLGNDESNFIVEKIKDYLPVTLKRDGFLFKEVSYNNDYCIYMIFPNPLNKKRYILLTNSSDLSNIRLKSEESLFTFKSDFVIFNPNISGKVLTGNFGPYWE